MNWHLGQLLVEHNGVTIPLSECTWVLRRPCECLAGIATAGPEIAGTDQAWRHFFAGLRRVSREIGSAQRNGYTVELLSPFDRDVPVYPLTENCPHGRGRENTHHPIPAGERYGRLVVAVARVPGEKRVQCRCDCGAEVSVGFTQLICGKTRSCGCYRSEVTTARSTRHGMADTRIYFIWAEMVARCTRPTHARYADYGGRGITVCEPWLDFANFYADMGDRPEGRSLDRTDNNKGYSPDNCRWATYVEQRHNRRDSKVVA